MPSLPMEEPRPEPHPVQTSPRRKLSERLSNSRQALSQRLSNSRHAISEQVTTSSQAVQQRVSAKTQAIKTKAKTKMRNMTPGPIRSFFSFFSFLARLLWFILRKLLWLSKITAIVVVCYLVFAALVAIPFVQKYVIFLNAITLPLGADFSTPEKYGFAPNRTLNFYIPMRNHQSLGAWFILSDPYYHALPSKAIPGDNALLHMQRALEKKPIILYLHGSGASRAGSQRVQQYQAFSTRLDANVLAIDYRGFADSLTGEGPSETTLVKDGATAFEWLMSNGKKDQDILVVGHGLGSSVAAKLGQRLTRDGKKCKGIVMLAPFSSMYEAAISYKAFSFIPLLEPFTWMNWGYGQRIIQGVMTYSFDTLDAVPDITAPKVLIAHAEDDSVVPSRQSDVLFSEFLNHHSSRPGPNEAERLEDGIEAEQREDILPPDPPNGQVKTTTGQRPLGMYSYPPFPRPANTEIQTRNLVKVKDKRDIDKHTNTTFIPKFGFVSTFQRRSGDENDSSKAIILVKTLAGEHDEVGLQEGLIDIVGKVFGIGRAIG
ncbi:alpha/beta-hydrolase [Agrocybe pediades]|nr:alpha/beta-hydrolase [Agrocybe pediades]